MKPPYSRINDSYYNVIQKGVNATKKMILTWGIHVNIEALHLAINMMREDPMERFTMEEILNHPWLIRSTTSDGDIKDKEVLKQMDSLIKSFHTLAMIESEGEDCDEEEDVDCDEKDVGYDKKRVSCFSSASLSPLGSSADSCESDS